MMTVVSESPNNTTAPEAAQLIPPSPTKEQQHPSDNKPRQQQRKSSSLPSETVDYLKSWMMSPEHINHPYPTEQEKTKIMKDTGIELKQLTNWFVNNRKRYWKPRVEARLQQQARQVAAAAAAATAAAAAAAAAAAVNGAKNIDGHGINLHNVLNAGHHMLPMTTPNSNTVPSQAVVYHQNHALVGSSRPYNIPSSCSPQNASHSNSVDMRQQQQTTTSQQAFINNGQHHPQIMYMSHPVSDSSHATSCCSSDSDNSISNCDEDDTDVLPLQDATAGHHLQKLRQQQVVTTIQSSSDDATGTTSEIIDETTDLTNGMVRRSETVHVCILKPRNDAAGALPTIEDTVTLPHGNVPESGREVEKDFPGCQITYCFENSLRHCYDKISDLREAEILKMKEYCLELHINSINNRTNNNNTSTSLVSPRRDEEQPSSSSHHVENNISSSSSATTTTTIRRVPSDVECIISYLKARSWCKKETTTTTQNDDDTSSTQQTPTKRRRVETENNNLTTTTPTNSPTWTNTNNVTNTEDDDLYHQRNSYLNQDMEKWRDVCRNARDCMFDDSLPSLDEATHMFGFSSSKKTKKPRSISYIYNEIA